MSLQGGRSAIFPDKYRNWGPSYSPTPMYATFTYVYQVPNLSEKLGFKPMKWVTDNWEMSGVTQVRGNIRAGYPSFSFANTNSTNLVTPNTTGTSGEGARVVVVGNVESAQRSGCDDTRIDTLIHAETVLEANVP